ncbi:actinodin3 [Hoplias malabaricus]|uniref:actinodin3 n=1 Tax=Hoplias malabaricus TaxID=27720 RepID=UPI00346323F5
MSSSLPIAWALSCIFTLLTFLQASPLTEKVRIDAARAHNFLTHSRPRREGDPKWFQKDPGFQSYYRYYSSIGHTEGLYEVDKIRMIYQQMRYLEQTYGPDASKYQNSLGLQIPKTKPPPRPLSTTTKLPPPPPAHPPLSQAEVIYLCNHRDPLCKPHIVYLPSGGVPILCDPRYNPKCTLPPAKEPEPNPPASKPAKTPQTPPPTPPPPIIKKGMEYDCDPYWDPDCLIDNRPRPVKVSIPPRKASVPERAEEEEKGKGAPKEKSPLYYDPYDYRRDLYDPYLYGNPADDPQ